MTNVVECQKNKMLLLLRYSSAKHLLHDQFPFFLYFFYCYWETERLSILNIYLVRNLTGIVNLRPTVAVPTAETDSKSVINNNHKNNDDDNNIEDDRLFFNTV